MADAGSSIFNKRATEKLRSPDDLDKYVRVTNPSVWVILLAIIVLLVGLFAWGVFGSVSTTVSTSAVDVKGKVVAFIPVDKVVGVDAGDAAIVEGNRLTITDVSRTPLSRDEATKVVGSDYLAYSLVKDDWMYMITIDPGDAALAQDVPLRASIVTESTSPISLILSRN